MTLLFFSFLRSCMMVFYLIGIVVNHYSVGLSERSGGTRNQGQAQDPWLTKHECEGTHAD